MPLMLADFKGVWHIDRAIEDRRTGLTGRMRGVAQFLEADDGLAYHETGQLQYGGAAAVSAEQQYLWQASGNAILVRFRDGRPFHRIVLSGAAAEDHHHCDPDDYCVQYDFAAWPDWTAVWRVSGPRKDYTSTTRYARGPDTA